eukprot:CAMPEP_0116874292 /NCGR_PEP_ID=MMETSP0463-20121206/5720_1 /TAXON_ID=181622 /ORGANISM="Strombidinopsis sp, Strain SopsisLIS2011" /LENGTH=112 /DNA_ID=CAMNT_0004517723 /DNA_START=1010 /DNA_END=1348 /DNA_ORIENTATION=-
MDQLKGLRDYVEKFTESEVVKKELESTVAIKEWLKIFDPKTISHTALEQLLQMTAEAEAQQKIAFLELLKFLVLQENVAVYVLIEHWEGLIEVAIMAYIACNDLQDPKDNVL